MKECQISAMESTLRIAPTVTFKGPPPLLNSIEDPTFAPISLAAVDEMIAPEADGVDVSQETNH